MLNNLSHKAVRQSWIAANKPLLWACMPMLAILLLVIGVAFFESSEEGRFQDRILQMQADGVPVDKESWTAWTKERTSVEGTFAWSEIAVMHEALTMSNLTYSFQSDLNRSVFLGTVPPDNSDYKHYLEMLRPLFKRVEQAVDYSKPVLKYDRSIYRGFEQLMLDLRLELLDAQCRHQVERSTAAMELLFRVNDIQRTSNQSDGFTGEVSYWGSEMEYTAINNGLSADIWDEPYIRKLILRLQPDQLLTAPKWRSIVIRERAMGLDKISKWADQFELEVYGSVDKVNRWIYLFPGSPGYLTGSVKNRLLDGCEAFADAANYVAGTPDPADRLGVGMWNNIYAIQENYFPRWEQQRHLFTPLVPAEFHSVANSLQMILKAESYTKLTRTALAVKLFKITKGRWPDELEELAEVGLSKADTHNLYYPKTAYQVDGESAFVWFYLVPSKTKIAPNLKSFQIPLENVERSELVRIR